MNHNYDHPIYEFSIDSRECAIDLKVNDLPCLSNHQQGGVALDWPINGNLLVSGKQIYSIHIFPYQNENFINKKAIVKAKIFVRDGFDFSKPKILVSEILIPDFSKDMEPRKEFKILSDFEAFIPYNHLGWNNSVNHFK